MVQVLPEPSFAATIAPLAGVQNFREVAGYLTLDGKRVRGGRVWRSAKLDEMTAADVERVIALKIALIADLRQTWERDAAPTPAALRGTASCMAWSIPLSGDESERSSAPIDDPLLAEHFVEEFYRSIAYRMSAQLSDLYRAIAGGAHPVLIHCSAGKDRTGVAVALLLDLLGVEREAILRDYTLTAELLDWHRLASSAALGAGAQGKWLANASAAVQAVMFDARASYLQSALDHIELIHGSTAEFVARELGLGDDIQSALRQSLLEPA